jgi:hypothetical protein
MKYSKETQNVYLAEIRAVMIKNPGISLPGIIELLAERGLVLDKDFVNRLRNKIEKRRAHAINYNAVRYSIEEIEEINLKIKRLWHIIEQDAPDRVAALRALTEERKRLEEIIMHLGGAQKDLGKISIEHTVTPELAFAIKSFQVQFGKREDIVKYEEAITSDHIADANKMVVDKKDDNPNIKQLPGGGSIDTKGPAILDRL